MNHVRHFSVLIISKYAVRDRVKALLITPKKNKRFNFKRQGVFLKREGVL